jgi:hypothetical protein
MLLDRRDLRSFDRGTHLPAIMETQLPQALWVESAEIRLINGRTLPVARICGKWYVIQSVLSLGVAVAVPIDESGREDWQSEPRLSVVIPADPASGRPNDMKMEDATDNPEVVLLARRFEELVATGDARPGPLGASR